MDDDATDRRLAARQVPAVLSINTMGTSPFVLICDHASNRIPDKYRDLGLNQTQRLSHIAWDPGALAVCHAMVALLDAPLIHSTVCRLVLDPNRDVNSPELIRTVSEATEISANIGISTEERAWRIEHYHTPFHAMITALLEQRAAEGRETILVCMHSFTPVYLGVRRPWPIGLIHGIDPDFTQALSDALATTDPSLDIGWNEPYAALKGVTFTLEEHGDRRNLPATMIEIRNDEIDEPDGVAYWADTLARALSTARQTSAE